MEAVRQTPHDWNSNGTNHPIIDPNWRTQPSCSRKEFMDELAHRVGAHYGLTDIRDAQWLEEVRTIPYGKKMTIIYTVEEKMVYILRIIPQSMIVF